MGNDLGNYMVEEWWGPEQCLMKHEVSFQAQSDFSGLVFALSILDAFSSQLVFIRSSGDACPGCRGLSISWRRTSFGKFQVSKRLQKYLGGLPRSSATAPGIRWTSRRALSAPEHRTSGVPLPVWIPHPSIISTESSQDDS